MFYPDCDWGDNKSIMKILTWTEWGIEGAQKVMNSLPLQKDPQFKQKFKQKMEKDSVKFSQKYK